MGDRVLTSAGLFGSEMTMREAKSVAGYSGCTITSRFYLAAPDEQQVEASFRYQDTKMHTKA